MMRAAWTCTNPVTYNLYNLYHPCLVKLLFGQVCPALPVKKVNQILYGGRENGPLYLISNGLKLYLGLKVMFCLTGFCACDLLFCGQAGKRPMPMTCQCDFSGPWRATGFWLIREIRKWKSHRQHLHQHHDLCQHWSEMIIENGKAINTQQRLHHHHYPHLPQCCPHQID